MQLRDSFSIFYITAILLYYRILFLAGWKSKLHDYCESRISHSRMPGSTPRRSPLDRHATINAVTTAEALPAKKLR